MATVVFMGLGAAFALLAALGLLRMPDLFNRMQAATKSSTLGVFFMMFAAIIHFGTLDVTVRALLVVVFLFATAPVAAHALSRAAYQAGVPLWPGSVRDELRDRYEQGTGKVLSAPPPVPDGHEGRDRREDQEGQEG
jgi:multicomponent Na+:H+ antiporter subunit G